MTRWEYLVRWIVVAVTVSLSPVPLPEPDFDKFGRDKTSKYVLEEMIDISIDSIKMVDTFKTKALANAFIKEGKDSALKRPQADKNGFILYENYKGKLLDFKLDSQRIR